MPISKTTLKYYGIPAAVALVLIIIVLIVPINPRTQPTVVPSPTQQLIPTIVLPTKVFTSPTPGPSPTLFPVPTFTGADSNQDIPQELFDLGAQKTTLRRQTPLTQSFGLIEFDYEQDLFLVKLNNPGLKSEFEIWRQNTYSSIPESEFIVIP